MPSYFGSADNVYTRAVGKNSLIAAVARVFQPGCKHDCMPILEGPQGPGKSTAIRILFGSEYFAEMKADPGEKDFEASLQGVWALEFAELETLDRASIGRIKVQLSVQSDWVRLAYRRDPAKYSRQCVFWGTSNEGEYLRDPSGGRRFWPIRCGRLDIASLERDRDQLWAEAVRRFRSGESWWEVPEQARDEQDARYQFDSWEEVIAVWVEGRPEITVSQILEEALGIEIGRHDKSAQTRVGNILRRLGWVTVRIREGTNRKRVYRPPGPTSEVGPGWPEVGPISTGAPWSDLGRPNDGKTLPTSKPVLSITLLKDGPGWTVGPNGSGSSLAMDQPLDQPLDEGE